MASADTICLAAIFLATFTVAQETGNFDHRSSEDDFFPDNFNNKQQQGSNPFHFGENFFRDSRTNRRVLHSPMAMFSFPKRQRIQPNQHSLQSKNSKASSILGSGNFGIIRGGIFSDHDDIPSTHHRNNNRHRNSDDNSRRTDFFQDFHEFRPSRAQLNNALSSREHWGIV